jgi:hypothetical protein
MIHFGKVSKGTVILPPEAHLPDGTEVRVEPVVHAKTSREERVTALRTIAAGLDGLPDDLARNHDHYLSGTPRK